MSDNLALWHSVEKTDTRHVKEITGKAYRGNSPKPYWLIQRATETFGPCGIGWGFVIVEEKLLDGALLSAGFYERIHMARVRVWYMHAGQRGEVEHVGQTAFCGVRKDGKPYTDEDAPKKSVTDALVKALSMIGFAGDIFMGRYDDSKYVAELKAEERRSEQQGAAKPSNVTRMEPPAAKADDIEPLITMGGEAASRGSDVLKGWWTSRSAAERKALGPDRIAAWKEAAAKIDAAVAADPALRGAA